MGIRHKFISLSDQYMNSTTENIIVNDIPSMEGFGDEAILNRLMTIYGSEIMSTVPKCSCIDGKGLTGRHNLGLTCTRCNSKVIDPQKNIGSNMWLRSLFAPDANVKFSNTPNFIPFMSPGFWAILSKLLYNNSKKRIKVDYLLWLCDDQMKLPPEAYVSKNHALMEDIVKYVLNGERSYVNVVNNIENLLVYLRNNPNFLKKMVNEEGDTVYSSMDVDIVFDLYMESMQEHKGKTIFTDYLPIINKHIFIMEIGSRGKYTQMKSAINIDVVKSWISLCSSIKEREELGYKHFDHFRIGRETARVISELSKLYSEYIKEYCYKKKGLLRKHCGGAKGAFTWRGVIRSISGPHDRNGVEIPWGVAVPLFTPHIANKLLKRGYTLRQINSLIYRSVQVYDPYIDSIIQEIRNEAPNGRVPMIIQRNPSLLRSSANLVYISKVSKDPSDKTIGFSQLIVKYGNGDYDGDALNCYLIMDKKMHDLFEPFDLKYAVADMKAPYSLTSCLTLLSTGNSIISKYLEDRTEDVERDTVLQRLNVI